MENFGFYFVQNGQRFENGWSKWAFKKKSSRYMFGSKSTCKCIANILDTQGHDKFRKFFHFNYTCTYYSDPKITDKK